MITKIAFFSPTNENVYRSQLMFRNKKHEVHTVEVNKIAKHDAISTLSRDDKSLCWSPILGKPTLEWQKFFT